MVWNKAVQWTKERDDQLIELWNSKERPSAAAIANIIGGVTRNAVIGRICRLRARGREIESRDGPKHFRPRPRERSRPVINFGAAPSRRSVMARGNQNARKPRPDLPAYAYALPPPEPSSASNVKLVELSEHHCRWPIGDPRDPGFAFCGAHHTLGSSYCEYHKQKAWYLPRRLSADERAERSRRMKLKAQKNNREAIANHAHDHATASTETGPEHDCVCG